MELDRGMHKWKAKGKGHCNAERGEDDKGHVLGADGGAGIRLVGEAEKRLAGLGTEAHGHLEEGINGEELGGIGQRSKTLSMSTIDEDQGSASVLHDALDTSGGVSHAQRHDGTTCPQDGEHSDERPL